MPKTKNSQQQTQRTSVQDFLTAVDSQKKQKWRAKLDKHRSQNDWTRETYQDDFRELKNDIDTVEELITDVQTEIKRIQGENWSIGDQPKAVAQAIQDFGGEERLKNLNRKGNFDDKPTIQGAWQPYRKLYHLSVREKQWISYQLELWKVAATKLGKVSDDFEQEYVDGKVAKRQMEYVSELQNMFEDKLENRIENKINEETKEIDEISSDLSSLETQVDKLEEQREQLMEIVERANRREKVMEDIIEELRERDGEMVERLLRKHDFEPGEQFDDIVEEEEDDEEEQEAQQQDLDQNKSPVPQQGQEDDIEDPEDILVTDEDEQDSSPEQGEFTSDETEPEEDDKDEEEESEEEYVANVEGKTVKEQFQALDKLRDHYDLDDMSQRDIVEYMDVPRGTLMNIILKDIYEELGETFPEITGKYGDDEE